MEEELIYRQEKSFDARHAEATELIENDPNRLPVIIERGRNEKFLPLINRRKYLIPKSTTLSNLYFTLRVRLQLHSEQSFFLLVNGRHMPTLTTSMADIYNEHKSEDGFLYLNYVSQEVFG